MNTAKELFARSANAIVIALTAIVGLLVSLYVVVKAGIVDIPFIEESSLFVFTLIVFSLFLLIVGCVIASEARELGIVISLAAVVFIIICLMAMNQTNIAADEDASRVAEYLESEYNLELIDYMEETDDGYIYTYCVSLGGDGNYCEVYLLEDDGEYSAYNFVGGEYYLLD